MSIETYSAIHAETMKAAQYLHRKAYRGELVYHGEAVESGCGCLRLVQEVVYGASERIIRHITRTYPKAMVVFAE